jgi:hypothetical protein
MYPRVGGDVTGELIIQFVARVGTFPLNIDSVSEFLKPEVV